MKRRASTCTLIHMCVCLLRLLNHTRSHTQGQQQSTCEAFNMQHTHGNCNAAMLFAFDKVA